MNQCGSKSEKYERRKGGKEVLALIVDFVAERRAAPDAPERGDESGTYAKAPSDSTWYDDRLENIEQHGGHEDYAAERLCNTHAPPGYVAGVSVTIPASLALFCVTMTWTVFVWYPFA